MSAFLLSIPPPKPDGTGPVLDLFPVGIPSRKLLLAKPMRPEKLPDFCEGLQEGLQESGSSWARFLGEIKYDGHSVTVWVMSDGRYMVQNRTQKERGDFTLETDASAYFTPLALQMQVKFMAEKCGLYEGREAGFLEVPAVQKLHAERHKPGAPPSKLVYRIFGIVSVNPAGLERTGENLSVTQTRNLLDRFLIKGNGMFEAAEYIAFRAWLHPAPRDHTLRFERQLAPGTWRTVAITVPDFHRYLLAEADALECEGFVLKKERVPPVARLVKGNTDSNGIFRDPSMVKAKREFSIHVVACLVVEGAEDRIKSKMVWLYGKQTCPSVYVDGPDAWQRLGYAGDATGHAFIGSFLKTTECAFFYTTEKEKAALRDLDPLLLQTEPERFVQVCVTCTNFSKTHFSPIGIKNNARREPLDFSLVTDLEGLAMSHPHFRSTKLASDRLAVTLQRHAPPEGKRNVKKRSAPSPPPPRLRSAYLAPTKQDVAVGPDGPDDMLTPPPLPSPQPTLTPPTEPTLPPVPTTGITTLHGQPVHSVYMWRVANGLNPRTGKPY